MTEIKFTLFALIHLVSLNGIVFSGETNVPGDAEIHRQASGSEIIIKTTSRLSGAVDSITWNGREFIDSYDHGRQLQSASNFDFGTELTAETYNPTEAGSCRDGAGGTSSSRLLHLISKGHQLQSTNQMAFWLAPGEKSEGNPSKNSEVLSNHLLTKRIQIGHGNLEHVIRYDVTFTVPIGEFHRHGVFEAVTGYMPADFEVFWRFNPAKGELEPLDDGPGEQSYPVVLATSDSKGAMGIYSPDQPSIGFEEAGYGRFRFSDEKVVKWNCVFRQTRENGLAAGEYTFHNFVVVGDLEKVKFSLQQLHQQFGTAAGK